LHNCIASQRGTPRKGYNYHLIIFAIYFQIH